MTTAAFSDDDGDLPEELRDTQDEVRRAADALNASIADLLAPQREMARLAREALMPAMDISRLVNVVNEALAPQRALQDQMRAVMQEFAAAQRLAAISPLEGVFAQIRENQQQYQDTFNRLADSLPPRIDTSFLDSLLHDTAPWQGLSDSARDALAGVLDDARTSVETGEDRDVPEEMVAELEEQAAQFAASVPGPLPLAMQKYLFAVFVASMVMATLMYVSIVSDTANAVLDEVYQHGELAVIVFTAACIAWDRKQGNRRDGDED